MLWATQLNLVCWVSLAGILMGSVLSMVTPAGRVAEAVSKTTPLNNGLSSDLTVRPLDAGRPAVARGTRAAEAGHLFI